MFDHVHTVYNNMIEILIGLVIRAHIKLLRLGHTQERARCFRVRRGVEIQMARASRSRIRFLKALKSSGLRRGDRSDGAVWRQS